MSTKNTQVSKPKKKKCAHAQKKERKMKTRGVK